MKLLICIDDTDDIESKGTGEIAEEIASLIEENGFGQASPVTRHQLYVHEDIPYTSHNSAMCFEVQLTGDTAYEKMIPIIEKHLEQESALEADPGLCIFKKTDNPALIAFGQKAKVQVLSKEEAYAFAKDHGIFLKEYGGTGDGIIGALAGTGLRLSGNDGRFRGKHAIAPGQYEIPDLKEKIKVDAVMDFDTSTFLEKGIVEITGKTKSVYVKGKRVLPVYRNGQAYRACVKEQLRRF